MSEASTSVDFYAGAGGWSLGLRMAGIEVVRSYEQWAAANETNAFNNGHSVIECDIRQIDPAEIPKTPIVVGSPPCTQFSLSNRGGAGDVEDGLKDISAFLRIVSRLKPRWWVMENVPSVLPIVSRELLPGGRLHEFSGLDLQARIFDMAEFGLAQRRRRCLIGNINFDLLESYSATLPRLTLGDIIRAFSPAVLTDPLYGLRLRLRDVIDHVPESSLNTEEERINRAVKTLHPVYNCMHFPDRLDRPARTVTATCTRVSRESIIIEAPKHEGSYRRLTIRERAMAQGFPISFQFLAKTYSQKLRMVGNALPPLFAFYVGHAILGTPASALTRPSAPKRQALSREFCSTEPERPAFKYPASRRFRFAVPSLRMKSGMRFELTNGQGKAVDWHVLFVFGTSRRILHLRPDHVLLERLRQALPEAFKVEAEKELRSLEEYLRNVDVRHLQDVWSHTGPGLTRPFMLLDEISKSAERLCDLAEPHRPIIHNVLAGILIEANSNKVLSHAPRIMAGMLVAAISKKALSIGPKQVLERMDSPPQERFTA
jgi:DNA (cytosine-5)-methyltransferase 1